VTSLFERAVAFELNANLYDFFRAGEIDAGDLSQIALWHFHNGGPSGSKSVAFGLGPDLKDYALKLVFHKDKPGISRIHAGPLLTDESANQLKAKIDDELRSTIPLAFGAAFLFSGMPLKGYFRYRDRFQIIPAPPEAPQGNSLHPSLVFQK
jgi:hypothetical protein